MNANRPAATSKAADNFYRRQPARAFWKRVVQDVHPLDIGEWYKRKYSISGKRIASAGSCFAQHLGAALRQKGFNYLDVEPAPGFLRADRHQDYGYNIYSARYGNVYTSRQLLQLLQRATKEFVPQDQAWPKGGGFVDPFRPTIEPDPLSSVDEVAFFQRRHLGAVTRLLEQCDVFVFTLGLTETWEAKADGAVFPVAPGVSGGLYDPERYRFLNLTYPDVVADMESFFTLARAINPEMRFLLTVSPVPLMATATDDQVVVATVYSKSVLRAAAGFLTQKYDFVDYFPSYEIISSPPMRGMYFNPDMRTASPHGVEHVMAQLFKEHTPPPPPRAKEGPGLKPRVVDREKAKCDEELLAVFGNQAR